MLWINGLTVILLVQGRREMAVLPAVIEEQLHYFAMDTWIDTNIFSTG